MCMSGKTGVTGVVPSSSDVSSSSDESGCGLASSSDEDDVRLGGRESSSDADADADACIVWLDQVTTREARRAGGTTGV